MTLPDRIVGNVRIDGWQKAPGHKVHRVGDTLYAHLPGRKSRAKVTFMALVIPLKGKPHLEVVHKGQKRMIPESAVK